MPPMLKLKRPPNSTHQTFFATPKEISIVVLPHWAHTDDEEDAHLPSQFLAFLSATHQFKDQKHVKKVS